MTLTQNFTASGYRRSAVPLTANTMDVAFINVFFPHGTMIANISRAAGRESCISVSSGILRNFFTSFKTFAILVELAYYAAIM